MGVVVRQSIKTSLVTFSGAALGAAILYLSTHILTTQYYGFSRNLITQSTVAIQVILMGVHSTLNIYIHKYPAGEIRRRVLLSLCLVTPIVFTILLSIPYVIFRQQAIHFYKPEDQALAARYFYLLPYSAFLWSFMTLLEQYLGTQMKVAASAFTREVALRVVQILILLLYAGGYISFDVFLVATVFSVCVPVFLMVGMALRTEGFGISFQLKAFSIAEYREIFRFTIYHLLTNFSVSLLGYIDALMLAPLDKSGTSAVAVYSPAVFLMSILVIPYRAIATSSLAPLVQSYEQKQMDKVAVLFRKAAINGWIVAVGMMAIIVCNLPNAVRILPPAYNSLTQVAVILMIGRMVDMLTGLNNELLSISNHYRILFWMTVGLVAMIIGFNLWLIPAYGVVGAALGTSIALSLYNIMKLTVVYVKLRLLPISRESFVVLFAGGAAMIPGYLLPFLGNAVLDAAVRGGIILVVFLILLLLLKPSTDLQEFVRNVRNSRRLF